MLFNCDFAATHTHAHAVGHQTPHYMDCMAVKEQQCTGSYCTCADVRRDNHDYALLCGPAPTALQVNLNFVCVYVCVCVRV